MNDKFEIGDVVERKDLDNEEYRFMLPGVVVKVDVMDVIVMIDKDLRYLARHEDLKLVGISHTSNVFNWVREEMQA